MKQWMRYILPVLLALTYTVSEAGTIKVIGNVPDAITKLNRSELRSLFMGGNTGYNLVPTALQPGNINRVIFNTTVLGLTESRIQSYWAQMRFTGRRKPPKEFTTSVAMLEYLEKHPGTIGYVSDDIEVPASLKVIFP